MPEAEKPMRRPNSSRSKHHIAEGEVIARTVEIPLAAGASCQAVDSVDHFGERKNGRINLNLEPSSSRVIVACWPVVNAILNDLAATAPNKPQRPK